MGGELTSLVWFAVCRPDGPLFSKAQGIQKRLGTQLLAVVVDSEKGRRYLSSEAVPEVKSTQVPDLSHVAAELADDPRNIWCRLYGLLTFADLFTRRQLIALTTFADLVKEAREHVLRDSQKDIAYANAVVTYLGLAVSRTANSVSSLAIWSQSRDQSVNVFSRQALPMTWDFPEVNPFAGAAGDFVEVVESIADTIESLPATTRCEVEQLDAQHRCSLHNWSNYRH